MKNLNFFIVLTLLPIRSGKCKVPGSMYAIGPAEPAHYIPGVLPGTRKIDPPRMTTRFIITIYSLNSKFSILNSLLKFPGNFPQI